MDNAELVTRFKAARDHIANVGWTQGNWFEGEIAWELDAPLPTDKCACALGACLVASGAPTMTEAFHKGSVYEAMEKVLQEYITGDSDHTVDSWNDDEGTEKEDVLSAFDDLIGHLENG